MSAPLSAPMLSSLAVPAVSNCFTRFAGIFASRSFQLTCRLCGHTCRVGCGSVTCCTTWASLIKRPRAGTGLTEFEKGMVLHDHSMLAYVRERPACRRPMQTYAEPCRVQATPRICLMAVYVPKTKRKMPRARKARVRRISLVNHEKLFVSLRRSARIHKGGTMKEM